MPMTDLLRALDPERAAQARVRVRRDERLAERERHIGADHCFAFPFEDAALGRLEPAPAGDEVRRRADDRIAARDIAEGDRRGGLRARIACKRRKDRAIDQGERLGLEIHGGEDELRLAARRADQQVEVGRRLRRRVPQAAFLRAQRHPDRHGDRHQHRRDPGDPAERAKISQDDGPGIHRVCPEIMASRPASSR